MKSEKDKVIHTSTPKRVDDRRCVTCLHLHKLSEKRAAKKCGVFNLGLPSIDDHHMPDQDVVKNCERVVKRTI